MRNTLLVLSTLLAASLAVVTLPENLFFYTKLETTTATDETGRLAAAQVAGTPTAVPGYNGNGVRFNPDAVATDAIFFAALPIAGPVTYTAWIYLESELTVNGKVLSNKADYNTDPLGNEIEITIPTDGTARKLTYVHGDKGVDAQNYAWVTNTWYHIAVVGAADGATLYVNGTIVGAKGAVSAIAIANPTKVFSIGSSTDATGTVNAGGAFRGIIDEVRVYNTTLTALQVTTVFAETFGVESSTSSSDSSTSSSDTSSTSASSDTTTVSTGIATSVVPSTTRNNNASSAVVSLFVVICSFFLMF